MAQPLAIAGGSPILSAADHTLWPILGDEERRALLRVLERGTLSGNEGPELRAFEEEFADYAGARYALMTHAGTSALLIGMAAAGVGRGHEVIFPNFGFIASPLAALHLGAVPRFADVSPVTGNLDPAAVERAITPRTKCIMPVHIHGCPADMDEILALAKKHNLVVVEDAAQAHGAVYKGTKVGTMGHGGGFSTQTSKNLSTGEGGVYVTNDRDAVVAANGTRNFGQNVSAPGDSPYDPINPQDGEKGLVLKNFGAMYRGNEMAAAVGRAQLKKLPGLTERCQANAAYLSSQLDGLPGVHATRIPEDRSCVYHKFRVHLDPQAAGVELPVRELRDRTMAALDAEGARALLWSDVPMSTQPFFLKARATFPVAVEDFAELEASYQGSAFPNTLRFLESTFLLFSQSYPLIAQPRPVVEKYAQAFHKVWERRRELPVAGAR